MVSFYLVWSWWFYIFLANVAVLTTHFWLFLDEPLASAEERVISSPVTVKSRPIGEAIFTINDFNFLFEDQLAPVPDELIIQLSLARKIVEQQEKDIQNARQQNKRQSAKITLLKKKNSKLHRQLFVLQDELLDNKEVLLSNNRKIEQLEEQRKTVENHRFTTDIDQVKNSIIYQPDLVNVKLSKKNASQSKTAQESLSNERKHFSGSVEFGYTYEQDNQITKAVKGRLILDYDEPNAYNINSDLDFEFENEDGETSTEKYRWQFQSDYNLDLDNLVFARSDVNRSQFASYEQEDIFTVGYGRIFFNTEKHKFNAEMGAGYRFSVPNVGKDTVSVDEFIVRTRLNYERILSDNLQVKMDMSLEAGQSNSVYSLNFKAQNRIYQELYLIFDFEYKFTENVPIDTVNKEVASGLSLLYAF